MVVVYARPSANSEVADRPTVLVSANVINTSATPFCVFASRTFPSTRTIIAIGVTVGVLVTVGVWVAIAVGNVGTLVCVGVINGLTIAGVWVGVGNGLMGVGRGVEVSVGNRTSLKLVLLFFACKVSGCDKLSQPVSVTMMAIAVIVRIVWDRFGIIVPLHSRCSVIAV